MLKDKASDICYRSPSAPGVYSVGIGRTRTTDTYDVHKMFNWFKRSDELTLEHRVKVEITRVNNDVTGCLDNGVDVR
jgi:hypothetical protein